MNTKQALEFLTVPEEQIELQAAVEGLGLLIAKEALFPAITLKRTFNQSDFQGGFIRYWRVMGPKTHPNLGSDISIMWLIENGYIRKAA